MPHLSTRPADAPSPALAPPPGNPRFPLFDGLRGLAVLAILAFHVWELTGRIGVGAVGRLAEAAGPEAVIAFFVISGFLLYRPFVAARASDRPGPRTRRYARRRALRILPGYWMVLTLLAIFPGIAGVFSGDWWRYYGYLQLYSARTEGLGIPVAWTLCVEVTFYIALPVWARLMRRLPAGERRLGWLGQELLALALVATAGVAVQLAAARHAVPYLMGVSLLGQCTWLAIGMALAALSVAGERGGSGASVLDRLAARPGTCWLGAGAALALLAVLVPRGGLFGLIAVINSAQPLSVTLARVALEGALVVLLVVPVAFGGSERGWPRRLLALAPLVWLGVISYSFYLWHLTVAELIALPRGTGFSAGGLNLLAHVHFARGPVLYVIVLAGVGALASVSYRFVELPFLRLK